MPLTASSESKASADFNGNKAGGIETWVWSGVDSQTSTQTTIRFIFGFDQDQTYSDTQDFDAWISGSSVYSSTYTNSKGSNAWQFYETTRTYNRGAYGSATDYHSARCQVGGIYNGPTSNTGTNDTTTGVPAKAGTVLGPPTSFDSSGITSSAITYTWVDPVSSGIGPAPTSMYLEVNTDPAFGPGFAFYGDVGNVNTKTVTGLNKATTYYARVRAINSVGSGAWSTNEAASTLATAPDAPVTPTVNTPTSTGFTVNFVAPANGGSAITSYTIEVSLDSFATVAATFTGVTTSPKVLTGLLPGKKYKARIKAINAIGTSANSPTSAEIQTLGGVKIWDGNSWEEAIVRSWNGTAWVVVIVRKWNGTAWVV